MRQWRLIYNRPTPGAYNMAIDETLLQSVASGESLPTLRLYEWEPFCLSLGYGQRIRDIDLQRIEANGWDIVRRPTGGKAILHGDELTYSVVLPKDHELAQGDVIESYRRISEALLAALRCLGLSPQSEKQTAGNKGLGPVCFEVPSHYEITADGKKLIGSAQVRRRQGILQHGSLPLFGDIARICDALKYPDEATRAAAKNAVRLRAVTLEDVARKMISWAEAAEAIVHGFAETFNIEFVRDEFNDNELEQVEAFHRTRYAHPDWMNKR